MNEAWGVLGAPPKSPPEEEKASEFLCLSADFPGTDNEASFLALALVIITSESVWNSVTESFSENSMTVSQVLSVLLISGLIWFLWGSKVHPLSVSI